MAPEQRDPAGQADHRADIYSLGVVLYELLTGELPGARLEPPSHKVQIDVRLDEIVLRALAVQPELRFATAAEFRTQLDTVTSQFGETPRPQPGASSVPRLLKNANGLLHTPEQLATFDGQFCVWRHRGQLLLDERQLVHSRDGVQTVIPLAAIRDVSLAQYPLTMNPVGVDFLSVTYVDAGQTKRACLAPMGGWFAWPSTWNARVADWQASIRNAAAQVTGREPAMTPREQVAVPAGHAGLKAFLMAGFALPMLIVFLVLTLAGGGSGSGGVFEPALFVGLMLLGGFVGQRLVWRFLQRPRASSPAISPWSRGIGALLILGALALGWGWMASRNAQARAETQGTVVRLQVATSQETDLRALLAEFTTRTATARDEAQRHRDQIEGSRLRRELDSATQRRQELERTLAQGVPKPDRSGPLLAMLLLLLDGLWLLLRTGTVASPEAKPRRWMQWLGGTCLVLGVPLAAFAGWIWIQISQDSDWNPGIGEAVTVALVTLGSVLLLAGGFWLLARARPGRRGGVGALVLALIAAALSAFLFLATTLRPGLMGLAGRPPLTSLTFEPVRLDDNVIVANLRSSAAGGPGELRVGLSGPALPGTVLADLARRFRGLPASLARSGVPGANRAWQLHTAGSNVWQVGFVFPTAAAAEETFRALAPLELGELESGSVDLFETIASDGQHYRGELFVGPPVNGSHAGWMSVTGRSSFKESAVTLDWEVAAGSGGLLHGIFGTTVSTVSLNAPYRTRGNTLRMELTRLSDHEVRLRTTLLGAGSEQVLAGDFDDLADELLGSACFSAKGVRGEEFELCRFNGNPFTVQLLQSPTTLSGRPKLAIMPILVLLLLAGLAALTVIAVVLAVRRRWGGAIAVVLLVVAGVAVLGAVLTAVIYVRAGVGAPPASRTIGPSEVR